MRTISFIAISLILSLTLSFVVLSSYSVQAATIYVDDDTCPGSGSGSQADPFCKIQDGIAAASSGETVEVAAGTYYENITMKNEVVIQGAGQGVSIIEGGGTDPVVTTSNIGSASTLDGFTITSDEGTTLIGMYNYFLSSPTVTKCTFSGNKSGGMYNYSLSSPTVNDCTFSGNSCGNGGGISNINYSSPTVTNCTFSGNTADDGGGMYNEGDSSPTVTNCTFSGNSSPIGGGMKNVGSSPTVTNCTFSGNSAVSGGGMFNEATSAPAVTNSIFSGNSAGEGGGIYNSDSSPIVTNCTFSGNSASFAGDGISNWASSPTLTNCILWGGDSSIMIYNVTSSTPLVTYSDIEGGYVGTGNINADPLFVDPTNGDFHLGQGSPCIDAGDNSAPNLPLTDIDGKDRKIDDPAVVDTGNGTPPIVDMGADEFNAVQTGAMPWLHLLLAD